MHKKSYARIGIGCVGLFGLFCVTYFTQMATDLKADSAPPPGKGAIYGVLVRHDGTAVKNAAIQLMTAPGMGQMPVLIGTTNTDAQGAFKFESVKPGEYTVAATWLSNSTSKKVAVHKGKFTHVQLKLSKQSVSSQPAVSTK